MAYEPNTNFNAAMQDCTCVNCGQRWAGGASVAKIIERVSKASGVPAFEILGPWREKRVSWPRMAVYYIARTTTRNSLPRIGRAMRRDHTTVLYGVNRARELLKTDQSFADLVAHALTPEGQGCLL